MLPLLMLAYYAWTDRMAGSLYVVVCPICIASMALDHASRTTAIVSWFFFCLANATLYAFSGACLLVLFTTVRRLFGKD